MENKISDERHIDIGRRKYVREDGPNHGNTPPFIITSRSARALHREKVTNRVANNVFEKILRFSF
jgi:hypothetical protein